MNELRIGSLASGYGGLDMAVADVVGGHVVWHAEYDVAPSKVLAHHWPEVPNLGDITAIDWTEVEPVDVLVGGYPCQPFSHAGKRRGVEDERHIWPWIADAIRVLRPRLCVFENVAGHLRLGFDTVLADLAAMGRYDVRWGLVRASDAGAPHRRERLFIVATDPSRGGGHEAVQHDGRRPAAGDWASVPDQPDRQPDGAGPVGGLTLLPTALDDFGPYAAAVARWEQVLGRPAPSPTQPGKDGRPRLSPEFVEWMMGLPAGHVTDPAIGLTRAQALKCLGNGVVPQQARLALSMLLGLPATGAGQAGALLPTPQAHDAVGGKTPDQVAAMRARTGAGVANLNEVVEHLLPTPAVNDMGEGKTPADWDQWTERMRAAHGNGNGHGKSLAIEAARLGGVDA